MRKSCYIAGRCGDSRISNGADTTRIGYSGQLFSQQIVARTKESPFGSRLREAFQGASNTEIAKKLGIQVAAVGNYMSGRVPPASTLLLIADSTSCSLHWLLTGHGEADLDPYSFMEPGNRRIVQKFAESSKQQLSEVLNTLIREAIRKRIADMVVNEEMLQGREIDDLRELMENLLAGDDDVSEPTASASPRTRRRA